MEEMRVTAHEDIYSLVRRIKKGDREAFMAVTHLYQKKVFLLAYSFFRNKEDALDIVQETFLRLYQKISMFQEGKNFQSWLLQITKNLCIDSYRRNHGRNGQIGFEKSIDQMDLSNPDERTDHLSSDIKEIISRCLKKLSERQRMIFVMKHYNNLEYNEIAQILNIALGTVKSLNFKAVQNMRVTMSSYLGRQT